VGGPGAAALFRLRLNGCERESSWLAVHLQIAQPAAGLPVVSVQQGALQGGARHGATNGSHTCNAAACGQTIGTALLSISRRLGFRRTSRPPSSWASRWCSRSLAGRAVCSAVPHCMQPPHAVTAMPCCRAAVVTQ
jgi:hypothetical protein